MFLTDEQAKERLNSEKNLANRFSSNRQVTIEEREILRPGKNRENLKEEVRDEIATRARLGEKGTSLAKEFGVTQGEVSAIKTGKVPIDEEKVGKTISEVRDRALDRLMSSLGLLTDDKLSGCSAKDLSVIASNMGRVVEKTFPRSEGSDKINLIIYAPELRQEKSYNVIEV